LALFAALADCCANAGDAESAVASAAKPTINFPLVPIPCPVNCDSGAAITFRNRASAADRPPDLLRSEYSALDIINLSNLCL
jgi:hypothetical protein